MRQARWVGESRAPATIRLGNAALGLLGVRRFSAGQLIDAARKQTGLESLGDEFFVPALERLVTSIHEEAELHPIGALIQKKRLIDLLSNRLRIEEALERSPEALEAELLPPVLIAGLQRSGTTLLHRLLAAHPDVRSLPSWEALSPGPLPSDPDDAKRRRIARKAEKGLRFIAPDFFAIHPVEAEAPEEEVLLLELSFMSQTSEAIMNVPAYATWLEGQDPTPAYQYMVRVLKLLQYRTPDKRHWVLKSPHHLEWLDVVLRVMPEATIVQTHRTPLATVASFCSMVAHGRAVFSNQVDGELVGKQWSAKIARLLERAMAVREQNESSFVDVEYDALVAAPAERVHRLFERVGWSTGEAVGEAVGRELRKNQRDRFGRHRYELGDFGLTESGLRDMVAPYMRWRGY